MSARVAWKGLAIVDAGGRVATWRGSETPKLFHSEEQSRHHRTDGDEFVEVQLMLCPGVMPPMSEERLVSEVRAALSKRRYADKQCRVCWKFFTPNGAHAKYCPECR